MKSAPGKSEDRHPMHPARACTLKSSVVSAKYNRCISPWIDCCLARTAIIVFRCLCLGRREHNCHTSYGLPDAQISCRAGLKLHNPRLLWSVGGTCRARRACHFTTATRRALCEADQLNFNSWSPAINMLIGRRSLSYRPPDPFPDEGRRA